MRNGVLTAALLAACSGEVDSGTTDSSKTINCQSSWSEVDGVQIDPVTCLGWSARSAQEMTWHEAISADETAHTDEDPSLDYCAQLSEGGWDDWRLPDAATLESLSTRSPPFDELDGHLWSRDSDTVDTLAWTVELSNPGLSLLLEKTQPAYVRCIVGAE